GIIIIGRRFVQTHYHVKPRADPFAGVDGAGAERRYDLTRRQDYYDGAQSPEHLGARPGHAVAQPVEAFRRGDLTVKPPAHLKTGITAKERLDVELCAERVP